MGMGYGQRHTTSARQNPVTPVRYKYHEDTLSKLENVLEALGTGYDVTCIDLSYMKYMRVEAQFFAHAQKLTQTYTQTHTHTHTYIHTHTDIHTYTGKY